jgi:hypothetical protein
MAANGSAGVCYSVLVGEKDSVKLRIYMEKYQILLLDPGPKRTESNQNSEFWITIGSDPTKSHVFGSAVGLKNPTSPFWIGFYLFWTRGGDALMLHFVYANQSMNEIRILWSSARAS